MLELSPFSGSRHQRDIPKLWAATVSLDLLSLHTLASHLSSMCKGERVAASLSCRSAFPQRGTRSNFGCRTKAETLLSLQRHLQVLLFLSVLLAQLALLFFSLVRGDCVISLCLGAVEPVNTS